MNQNPFELRKVRDFGQCISDAFLFLKQHFKPLVTSVFAIGGLFLAAQLVSSFAYHANFFRGFDTSTETFTSTRFGTSYFLNLGLLMFTYAVISCTVNCYLAVYLDNPEGKPTLPDVWKYFTSNFLRILGGLIVAYLAFIVGLLLCIIPGIWLMPIISLMNAVIVVERASPFEAFDRSRRLIKQNWWYTLGVIMISAVMVAIPGYVLSAIIAIFGGVSAYFSTGKISSALGVGLSVVQVILQILYVFPAIATAMCYFSLVEEKESVGMLGRIENFGGQKEQGNRYDGDLEEQY